jgi:hypothetical protein
VIDAAVENYSRQLGTAVHEIKTELRNRRLQHIGETWPTELAPRPCMDGDEREAIRAEGQYLADAVAPLQNASFVYLRWRPLAVHKWTVRPREAFTLLRLPERRGALIADVDASSDHKSASEIVSGVDQSVSGTVDSRAGRLHVVDK